METFGQTAQKDSLHTIAGKTGNYSGSLGIEAIKQMEKAGAAR